MGSFARLRILGSILQLNKLLITVAVVIVVVEVVVVVVVVVVLVVGVSFVGFIEGEVV